MRNPIRRGKGKFYPEIFVVAVDLFLFRFLQDFWTGFCRYRISGMTFFCRRLPAVLWCVSVALEGESLGKRMTKLCIANRDGSRVVLWRSLLRYGAVCGEAVLFPLYIQFSFDTVHCGSGGKAAVLPVFVGRLVSVGHFSVFLETALNRSSRTGRGLPPWMDFRHEDSEYGQTSDRFITKSGLER